LRRLFGTPGLALVFLVLSLVKIAHHEMWRDELEYWDAARQSRSLAELRQNTRYMGQPPLGHLVLYSLSRLTRDPRAMQLLNVLIVTVAVTIVAALAPWPAAFNWLFALGYFPFFEYGTISRHYALSLLLLVAFCAAYGRAQRLSMPAAGFGFLLALSNFHSTIIVIAIVIAGGAELVWERRRPTLGELSGTGLLLLGIAVSVAFARPPSDSRFLHAWGEGFKAAQLWSSLGLIWNGWAPLPALHPPIWNRNLLDIAPTLKALLGLALLASFSVALRRFVQPLVLLVSGTVGLLVFSVLQRGSSARHCGLIYLVLVAALWLAGTRGPVLRPWVGRLFGALLVAQVVGGLSMSYQDLVLPFSSGVATARYLRESSLDSLPIVGQREDIVALVAALLDRPFYFPASHRWTTRAEGNRARRPVTRHDLGKEMLRLSYARKSDVIAVMSYRLEPLGRLELLRCFEGSIIREDFCVYRARRPNAKQRRRSRPGISGILRSSSKEARDASHRSLWSDPGA